MIVLAVPLGIAGALLLRQPGTARAGAETAPTTSQPTRRPVASSRPTEPVAGGRPSDKARLTLRGVITGNISPKSVASSGTGYVTAQNMMYRHTITVYDARTLKLVKTISDAVRLRSLGYPSYPGTSRGAPVEAAFTSDGRYAYVSNYSMYGANFGPEGDDDCTPCPGTATASSTGSTWSASASTGRTRSARSRRSSRSRPTTATCSSRTGARGT